MYFVVLFCALFCGVANGESACDEVDILFMIDDESILVNGGDDIVAFIEYIALRQSGEHTGFSVGVYGEKIPVDLPQMLVHLVDTAKINQRAPLIEGMQSNLTAYFAEIVANMKDGGESQAVTLPDLFDVMTSQTQPQREYLKKNRICGDDNDCEMGLNDDSKRIFVFDHSSKLVGDLDADSNSNPPDDAFTSNEAICDIIDFIDDEETEGEALLIMTGPGSVCTLCLCIVLVSTHGLRLTSLVSLCIYLFDRPSTRKGAFSAMEKSHRCSRTSCIRSSHSI